MADVVAGPSIHTAFGHLSIHSRTTFGNLSIHSYTPHLVIWPFKPAFTRISYRSPSVRNTLQNTYVFTSVLSLLLKSSEHVRVE